MGMFCIYSVTLLQHKRKNWEKAFIFDRTISLLNFVEIWNECHPKVKKTNYLEQVLLFEEICYI